MEDLGMKEEDLNEIIICFKSWHDNFVKEESNIKNNTLRKIDLSDDRFIKLIAMKETGNYGFIEIEEKTILDSNDSFRRKIRDVTIFDDWIIITWEEKEESLE